MFGLSKDRPDRDRFTQFSHAAPLIAGQIKQARRPPRDITSTPNASPCPVSDSRRQQAEPVQAPAASVPVAASPSRPQPCPARVHRGYPQWIHWDMSAIESALAIFMFPLLEFVSSLTCETTIPPRMSLFYALSASMAEPAGAPGERALSVRPHATRITVDNPFFCRGWSARLMQFRPSDFAM
jgi:hypothetical protein